MYCIKHYYYQLCVSDILEVPLSSIRNRYLKTLGPTVHLVTHCYNTTRPSSAEIVSHSCVLSAWSDSRSSFTGLHGEDFSAGRFRFMHTQAKKNRSVCSA